ncbi:MAG: phosphoribosylformylglycinamidine synthase subunit PurL [Candidatus Omnitrophica bacterium]|nr:phosphoribosylformylglycinamidine synthase subunit PurL [Candidatus Omnitrophota bacterium]
MAVGVKRDIRDLGINGVSEVEYICVYTIGGDFSREELSRLSLGVLTDMISQECDYASGFNVEESENVHVVEVAYNAGVMDPTSESIIKAAKDSGIQGIMSARSSKKYIIHGKLSKEEFVQITDKLLYNKVIQHIVSEKEEKIMPEPYKFKHEEIDIMSADDEALLELSFSGALYLSLAEMKAIKEYFSKLKRNPTPCELETIAQTWSEHCKHKTMMGAVIYNGKRIENLLSETVMKVTRDLNKPWCVSVFKDNAGIIEFDSKHNICFKVETHNHPSALEPYGGAETGIGGVIRDPLGTGLGSKPIINTDIFCFGLPDMEALDVPKGALHPKRVLKGVVSGVRDYGNKMGIPTTNGAVCFDPRYTGNPLVFCGNVGIMPKEFSFKQVSEGDLIVSVGGRTGRDGIHGATFSSAELTSESEICSGSAVQIGNPITEKKVADALLKARDLKLYEAITDCGAGGFSSAVGEMGENTGAEVYLEKAPLKYEGLKPWEIWVSEAQERMVLAVKEKNLEALKNVFKDEFVEVAVIGKFTGEKKLRLYYEEHKVADLDMDFIHNGLPRTAREAIWEEKEMPSDIHFPEKEDYTEDLLKILSDWNVCSKEWIIRQYDHEVQGGSVLKPLVGPNCDGPADASVTRPFLDSPKGIVVSNGINPAYADIDPYWMAASAIDEALRQIVAVGGTLKKVALLDNFCWGNTEDPRQLGSLVRASEACYRMAKVFGTPFISGKDSLNNEFNADGHKISIPPTLLISAIGVIDDVDKTISMDIKRSGNLIYVVGKTYHEMGGSRYFAVNGQKLGLPPKVDPERSLSLMEKLSEVIQEGLVASAHDSSEGGLAVALSEMLFAGGYGARIRLKEVPVEEGVTREDVILFSESNSRFIVEVSPENKEMFEKKMNSVPVGLIGEVTEETKLTVFGNEENKIIETDIDTLKESWKKPFRKLMHEES